MSCYNDSVVFGDELNANALILVISHWVNGDWYKGKHEMTMCLLKFPLIKNWKTNLQKQFYHYDFQEKPYQYVSNHAHSLLLLL